MILEVLSSTVMGGVLVSTYLYQHGGGGNDAKKIERIAANAGLIAKDGKAIRIYRRTKKEGYTEYAFQMPQGMSSKQFSEKLDRFQDGLNIKKTVLDISLADLKELRINKDILDQVKRLLEKKRKLRKEVEIHFDGMLIFKVFKDPLTDSFPYDDSLIKRVNGWQIPVGLERSGTLVKHDFEQVPHMALGGATRYGKSNFLNSLIVSLLKKQPDNVTFTLIDLKGGVEFADYENVRQVKDIAYEPEEAVVALENAYNDMRAMQAKLRGVKKKKVQDAGIKERHFIIIDEVGELNPGEAVSKGEREIKERCQKYMSQIARLGAGLGFRQILATQYGTGDVIPRQCKQNSDAKLCFRVRNGTASRVVLDEEGAEKLPLIKGRAIYQTDKRHVVQTPYIDEDMIASTIGPHINIRPRKEPNLNAEASEQGTTGGKHSLVIKDA
ncbi:FtsK/SpoIIIE domain-containing protein [Priestia megaterium]|uniref:FtsK/SpoIIIE domain-containing protein n=1 Tax=Priestia megaterium TaxID=1404 RepID=UPI00387A5BDD